MTAIQQLSAAALEHRRRGAPAHPLGHCTCETHTDRPWNRPEHWTLAEVNYLHAHFGRATDAAIAGHLGRTVLGIRLKAKRLGLHKRDIGMSATEVGRLLAVDTTIVTKCWIAKGLLKARRGFVQGPHRTHVVTEAAVEAFIRDHGQWLDAERVPDDSPFKAIAMANRWVSLTELTVRTGHGKSWLMWYLRSGLMRVRRRGPLWYVHPDDAAKLPCRDPEAIAYARFVRDEMLARRNAQRNGIAA